MSRMRFLLAVLAISASAVLGTSAGAVVAAKSVQGPVAVVSATTPTLSIDRNSYYAPEPPDGVTYPRSFNLGGAATFTQKAGQVVLVAGKLTATSYVDGVEAPAVCDLNVDVWGTAGEDDALQLGFHLYNLAARGDINLGTQSVAVPAPASDTVITMSATAIEGQQVWSSEAGGQIFVQCPEDPAQTWQATLNLSIVALPATNR